MEEGMACLMDGTTMCPPSLTSSPECQIKNNVDIIALAGVAAET